MNSRDIISSMSFIDTELLERSENRVPKRRRAYRIAAAAAALLIVFGAAFGVAKAAGAKEPAALLNYAWQALPEGFAFMADTEVPKEAVLPASQTGGAEFDAEYNCSYDIITAFEDSEAVCLAVVGNCLGETESGTYFDIKPEKIYKGVLPETFTLYQCANSEFTFEGSPLYTYGDKLLLFLIPWGRDGFDDSYETAGSDLTVLYAAVSEDGGVYLIDHKGVLSYLTGEQQPELKLANYACDSGLAEELFRYLDSFDKTIAHRLREYQRVSAEDPDNVPLPMHIYSVGEIEALFKDIG